MKRLMHVPPSVGGDLVAARGQDVPFGAELVQPLPCGVPRPVVVGVVVERVTTVGHLGTAAVAADARSEQGTGHAGPGLRGTVRDVRRPRAGACAVALGLAPYEPAPEDEEPPPVQAAARKARAARLATGHPRRTKRGVLDGRCPALDACKSRSSRTYRR